MHKFPSIEQFRTVIRNVTHQAALTGQTAEDGTPILDRSKAKPKLKFHGTVKMHGTNAAVVFKKGVASFQSRERVITLDADNCGFAEHMSGPDAADWISRLSTLTGMTGTDIAVFGEWCGGNIQKGVGISGLPKMFVIFAVKSIGDNRWLDLEEFRRVVPVLRDEKARVFTAEDFPTWDVEIDFASPQEIQNKLIELTIAVEDECPVAKAFGQTGVGEGIVWKCSEVDFNSSDFWFKVKGEKHSASKVRTLAAVDTEAIVKAREFVEMAVTEQRLEQGLQNLVREQGKPFEMASMGDFIRWVIADVMKEEKDTLAASGLDAKKLGGPIAEKARSWFISQLNDRIEVTA